jgi:release factor glutamine methyltransferase
VYEPAEDTELLARALAQAEPDMRGLRCLDVGTGTGAIALALHERGARVAAVDVSPLACRLARENLGAPVVVRGDLATAFRGPFDLVAFNAPYLPSSPEERVEGWLDRAFHGGEGGVEVSARLIADLPRVLAPHGRAYLVVSSRADLPALGRALAQAALVAVPVASARWFFEEVAIWRIVRVPSTSPNP